MSITKFCKDCQYLDGLYPIWRSKPSDRKQINIFSGAYTSRNLGPCGAEATLFQPKQGIASFFIKKATKYFLS